MSTKRSADEKLRMDELLEETEGVGRREFITKMAAVCGLPALGALLGGCGGGGLLDSDRDHYNNGTPPPGRGDLQAALFRWRCLLAQWLEQIQRAGGRGNVNVASLLGLMNPEFAVVWAVMIGASALELRGNVAPDMQTLLDSIDPDYEGGARQVTEQQLQGARQRADEMVETETPTLDEKGIWVFLVMAFLLFPAIAGATAMGWAEGAWERDTDDRALLAWFWFNSSSPHPWSAALIAQMTTAFFIMALYLYQSMGATYLAEAPGLMFGRNWLVLLMMLLLLLTASWTGGTEQ
jgi:hypothetical protein